MMSNGENKTKESSPPIEKVIAYQLKYHNHHSNDQSQQLMMWRALEFLALRDHPDALHQIRIMAGLHGNSSSNNLNFNFCYSY